MLQLRVLGDEYYDERNGVFTYPEEGILELEHSLISLSKWESRWNKPFLSNEKKSPEESVDYVRCMTLNTPDNSIYDRLTADNMDEISSYVDAPMTATTFSTHDDNTPPKRSIITAEIIYYWMITLHIPLECENWHLNRLMALIKVCSIKNAPPKKMNRRDMISRNKSLNRSRRQAMNTRG